MKLGAGCPTLGTPLFLRLGWVEVGHQMLCKGMTAEVAEKLFVEPVLCQGMTLVVPQPLQNQRGL
jgi:hypothetical protein